MDYIKHPISLEEQISRLKRRGLIIDNNDVTKAYLTNISYYRLRAYTYPFQENKDRTADHRFLRSDIHFADIIDLYCFDRRLRILLFNAIEKIEVAVRARIIQAYADATNDSHWFTDETLFTQKPQKDKNGHSTTAFAILQDDIKKEVGRSKEDFIKYYEKKYHNPTLPPAWMTLEVLSLGTLSRLYSLLATSPTKTQIARDLGLPNARILENWLYAIASWRNHCAHHSRIWNRRSIINIVLPYNTYRPFISKKDIRSIHTNKFFAVLCSIRYLSNQISPDSAIQENLSAIIADAGKLLNLQEMGFPENWREFPLWK